MPGLGALRTAGEELQRDTRKPEGEVDVYYLDWSDSFMGV